MQIWKKKPLEEPFLALDPCKTNLLKLQEKPRDEHKNKSYKILCRILSIYSQMKIEILLPTSLSTKYFVESFQAKQMQQIYKVTSLIQAWNEKMMA